MATRRTEAEMIGALKQVEAGRLNSWRPFSHLASRY